MDRNELIKQAIAQCEKDIAGLQEQRSLLLSSLKPTVIKKNGAKPNGSPPVKPPVKPSKKETRSKAEVSAEEIQSVLECFGQEPLSLGSFDVIGVLDTMPKAKLRACLDALVENGDINQHGNRRSLCWVKSGVEFSG